MYKKRLSSTGMSNNKYWYDPYLNHGANTANALPNCTEYCVGRAQEIAEANDPLQMFRGRTPGGFPVAKDFLSDALWETGSYPMPGAIAVWGKSTDKTGHVATVEAFDGNHLIVSQSNYGGTYFEVKEYDVEIGKVTKGVGYVFQGFVYNPYVKDNRVARNRDMNQVEILADTLNVRKSPNGEKYSGRFALEGIYNILDMREEGEYIWAKIDDECWIALNDEDGWTVSYPKEAGSQITELETEIDRLNNIIKDRDVKISQYKDAYDELLEIKDKAISKIERIREVLDGDNK